MKKRSRLGDRAAALKALAFPDLFAAITGADLPERLPATILCPLPDHRERTPSCRVWDDHWRCFGCSRGGDVVDLARACWDLDFAEAVERVERVAGRTFSPDDVLGALLLRAETKEKPEPSDWRERVRDVEREVLARLRPYLSSRDWVVHVLTEGPAGYVFGEIDDLASSPPATRRARRLALDSLRSWALGWVDAIERDVLRRTGRDPLDVASLV